MTEEYSREPEDGERFTASRIRLYDRLGRVYDLAVRKLPVWGAWLRKAVPFIRGPRVLEVSFGTGYLLTLYAAGFETYGIDYSRTMVEIARENLARAGVTANLRQGNVEAIPYEDEFFDSVVNTMSFSGYPDGTKALAEMRRVLKPGGRLILMDVNYPSDGNRIGTELANLWKLTGDLIRDMDALFRGLDFSYQDMEIGGYGSVHLYVAMRKANPL